MATLTQSLQHILENKDPLLPVETKRVILKESLQAYALDFIYNHSTFRQLNFYGGTCLHMVYGLNRLSEDLDFDNSIHINIDPLEGELLYYFQKSLGFPEASIKYQRGGGGIIRLTCKFPVLNALGLSLISNEALHLKIEISHHEQVAMVRHTPLFIYGHSLVAAHFSLETMMAGKVLACLERSFERGQNGARVKGRDFYDLLWLMQQHIQPLAEKISGDSHNAYTVQSAMKALRHKVEKIKASDLEIDLLPLFESRSFILSWIETFHENFLRLVKDYLPED